MAPLAGLEFAEVNVLPIWTAYGKRRQAARTPHFLVAEVFGDGFGAGADLEFFVDAADVGVDSFEADVELVGNFFVEKSFGQEFEDFLFAGGKVFGGFGGGGGLLEALDDFAGDVAGHGGAAAIDVLNGAEEFFGRGRFEQVSGGAVGEGLEDLFGVLVHREHHDLARGFDRFEFADAIDAAHAGKVDVHEDDFGLHFWNADEGFFAGGIVADAFEPGRAGNQASQAFADARVIFNDRNSYRHRAMVAKETIADNGKGAGFCGRRPLRSGFCIS